MARVDVGMFFPHPHLAAPAAGRLRGEHARRSAHASSTDSPWLSERSAPARSEFHGAPRNRPAAGLPRSNAKGSQTVGRLSFGYFSLAKQRTSTSPAGARPGLRPQKKHTINYKNNSYQRFTNKRQSPKTPKKTHPSKKAENPTPTPAPTPSAPRPQPGRHGAFPPGCAPPAWRRSTPYRPHTAPKAHPASWHPARPSQCSPPA
jgi:hypothetical protein